MIDQVLFEHSGQYVCEATNGYGGQRNELTIKVLSAPRVVISPTQLSLAENSRGVLQCIIENKEYDEECFISWMVGGKILEKVKNLVCI